MTLLEVLVSISILGFGILGMMAMQLTALRDEAVAREQTDAARIARDTIEAAQRLPFNQVVPTGGDYETPAFVDLPDYPPGQIPVQVQLPDDSVVDQRIYTVSWRVGNVMTQPSLRTVDVQLQWKDDGDIDRTLVMSTIKYDP